MVGTADDAFKLRHSCVEPDWDVFLSHSGHEKLSAALPLTRHIQREFFQTFMDMTSLHPGHKHGRMLHAIATCSVAIVLASRCYFDANRSSWPTHELKELLHRGHENVLIVPVFFADVDEAAAGEPLAKLREHILVYKLQTFKYSGNDADSVSLCDRIAQYIKSRLPMRTALYGLDDVLRLRLPDDARDIAPSTLLVARYGVVPFHGRHSVLDEIYDFATKKLSGLSLLVLRGDAGTGKTRMMQQFALCMQGTSVPPSDGMWRPQQDVKKHDVQFLKRSATVADWSARLHGTDRTVTVVIDYADSRPTLLELLEVAAGRPAPTHIVLLARGVGDWWVMLREQASLTLRSALLKAKSLQLGAVASERPERKQLLASASAAFSKILNTGERAGVGGMLDLDNPEYDNCLHLLMMALHQCCQAVDRPLLAPSIPLFDGSTLKDEVLIHEARFWQAQLQTTSDVVLDVLQVVAALTLLGGAEDRERVEWLVVRVKLSSRLDQLDLFKYLQRWYPATGTDAAVGWLEPDLLGEELIHQALSQRGLRAATYLKHLVADHNEAALNSLFALFTRMSSNRDGVVPWIASVIEEDVPGRLPRAVSALMALTVSDIAAKRMDAPYTQLGKAILPFLYERGSISLAQTLRTILPSESVAFRDIALWCSRKIWEHDRNDLSSESTVEILVSLSQAERNMGLAKPALLSAQKAMKSAKRLIQEGAAGMELLAMVTSNLAFCLDDVGRTVEALPLQMRVVNMQKRLTSSDPATFDPLLALNCANLSVYQSKLGRLEDGVQTIQLAVSYYRSCKHRFGGEMDLIDTTASLAKAMYTLSKMQLQCGSHNSARESVDEAVRLYRELVERKPDSYLPEYSRALTNKCAVHLALRQFSTAMDAQKEAIGYLQRLTRNNPEIFENELAGALDNLGLLQFKAQDPKSMEIMEEAVKIRKRLYRTFPTMYAADYALTLNNLTAVKGAYGSIEHAIQTGKECISIYRDLCLQNDDAFQLLLAHSFYNLGMQQFAGEKYTDALVSFDEGGYHCTQRFGERPERSNHLIDLIDCYIMIGKSHLKLQNFEDAISHLNFAIGVLPNSGLADVDSYDRCVSAVETMSDCIFRLGTSAKALKHAQGLLEYLEGLARVSPVDFSYRLAACYAHIGNCEMDRNDHSAGIAAFHKAAIALFSIPPGHRLDKH